MSTKQKVISLVIAVALVVGAYMIYQNFMFEETDDAQIEGHSFLLAPKVTGYILKVNVVEGQKVKAGDTLIEIDPRDYENILKQSQSELTSVTARRADTEKNFHRLNELFSKAAVSRQQFDTAATVYSEAKARFDAITAQVNQAQINLDYTQIKAPMNGIIARKSAEVGMLATPGIPLLGFVDTEERWVTANFKETDLGGVKVGAKVDIDVDAVDHRSYHGEVQAIMPATGAVFTLLPPDNATGNFTKVVQRVPVKIAFKDLKPDDMDILRAGLSVVVKVHKR
jgi:membrane fusion protein, multidrug efflux system